MRRSAPPGRTAPFILIATTDEAVDRDALRSVDEAVAHVRSIRFRSATARGHSVQLHGYTCGAAVSGRLAG